MTSGLKTILYPVKDLSAAKELYGKLFGTPYMDESYYVGWGVAGQDVGLDPNGDAKGMTGPVGYWHVDDIEATLDALADHLAVNLDLEGLLAAARPPGFRTAA